MCPSLFRSPLASEAADNPCLCFVRQGTTEAAKMLKSAANVINTVEKMQGQERDLVIVCYGSFDLDKPGELDFAYQRERLNTCACERRVPVLVIYLSAPEDASH